MDVAAGRCKAARVDRFEHAARRAGGGGGSRATAHAALCPTIPVPCRKPPWRRLPVRLACLSRRRPACPSAPRHPARQPSRRRDVGAPPRPPQGPARRCARPTEQPRNRSGGAPAPPGDKRSTVVRSRAKAHSRRRCVAGGNHRCPSLTAPAPTCRRRRVPGVPARATMPPQSAAVAVRKPGPAREPSLSAASAHVALAPRPGGCRPVRKPRRTIGAGYGRTA